MGDMNNTSSVMLYKIIKDYEATGRTVQMKTELDYFAERVMGIASKSSGEEYPVGTTTDAHEDLLKICDENGAFYVVNSDKYTNGGVFFVKQQIAKLSYPLLKGATSIVAEAEDFRQKHPNTSVLVINYPDGEKRVSAVFWDKGPIVIGDKDNSMEN